MAIARLIKKLSGRKTAPAGTGAAASGGNGAALDYPQEGETIVSPQYTFRVGAAGEPERVEISLNQGPWLPCRYAVGYWWYDWTGYTSGRYQAAVRVYTKGGQAAGGGTCEFQVSLEKTGKRRK